MRYLIFLFLFISCDIHKQSQKSKTDTEVKNDIETTTETQSENKAFKTSFTIEPVDLSQPIKFGGKTYENSKIIYVTEKVDGKQKVVEVKADKSEVKQTVKEKAKEKKEEVNFDWLIYIIIGVVILGMFALFLMYRSINKNTAIINQILKSNQV